MTSSALRPFGQRQAPDAPRSEDYVEAAWEITAIADKMLSEELEQRRYRRVKVRLAGRFMRENQHEYPCYTNDVSAGGISFTTPVECFSGEFVVAYVEELGRVEGVVVRSFDNGFAIALRASQAKRERIIAALTWLLNRHELSGAEARRFERRIPTQPQSSLKLGNGREIATRVLDLSLGGARIETSEPLQIGDVIHLGRTRGRVVRIDESGIAIRFDHEQPARALNRFFATQSAGVPRV